MLPVRGHTGWKPPCVPRTRGLRVRGKKLLNWQQRLRALVEQLPIQRRKFARVAGVDRVRLDTWLLGVISLRRDEMDRIEWVANRAGSETHSSSEVNLLKRRTKRTPQLTKQQRVPTQTSPQTK